jgi:hypothetical protein
MDGTGHSVTGPSIPLRLAAGLLAVIGFWMALAGAAIVLLWLSAASPDCTDCRAWLAPLVPLGILGLAVGTAHVVAWDGLRRRESWGRRLGTGVAGLMLVVIAGAWLVMTVSDVASGLSWAALFVPLAAVYATVLLGLRGRYA